MKEEQKTNILIYKTEDGKSDITVRLENEDVWLSQQQMAELYQTSRTNVVEHIKHIFEEGELPEEATCRKFRQVQKEGSRNVAREIPFYNLDMIISLGYRIKSRIATSFRIWATKRLNEYIRKGFTMDDERLKGAGGGNYCNGGHPIIVLSSIKCKYLISQLIQQDIKASKFRTYFSL